jgi:DnaJ-domain-containing protein 1
MIDDFFNKLLDMTLDIVETEITPELRKLAKQAVKSAQSKADTAPFSRPQGRTRTRPSHPPPPKPSPRPQNMLYDVLEVSPRASQATIEAAYKSLAKRHHPDVGGSEAKMKEITAAYQILKDEALRKKYNQKIGIRG